MAIENFRSKGKQIVQANQLISKLADVVIYALHVRKKQQVNDMTVRLEWWLFFSASDMHSDCYLPNANGIWANK